jgi:LuxR family transcriptional regulator, maltose regulon positive regulatory protein
MPSTVGDSRLIVPRLPPRHISRPRLLAELDRVADTPLTLLAAGPGSGKTVLLSDWVRHTGARVAWLTPTTADADPRRFWPLLAGSLDSVAGIDRGPPGAIPQTGTFDLVQALLANVPDHAPQLVVVIDDAHVLNHPEVLDGLDRLIRGSQGLRFILSARSDPLLPLHRYRLGGQMHELRAANLALTPAEMQQMLASYDVTLAAHDFDLLAARTEGWAAGVRLSAMRMEGTEYPAAFVSELALDQGSIGEYLVDEVLRRLPEPHRRLLVETSFLGEVTGPLADAVTGMAGCGDLLDQLARENSFVIPLDAAQTRFRYHQLLAEILRYLLRRPAPRVLPQLQRRAAAWFEAAGDLKNALYWAVQAADGPYVASLLARGAFVHAFVHRQDLAQAGLRELLPLSVPGGEGPALTAELTVAHPAMVAIFAGPEVAARELERIAAARADELVTDPDLLRTFNVVQLVLGQKAGDACAVDDAVDRLLGAGDQLAGPVKPELRAAVLLAQASMRFWHSQYEDVGALLQEALADAERSGSAVVELEVLGMRALVASCWSRRKHADDATQRARTLLAQHAGLASPPALELAGALRLHVAGDLHGRDRVLQQLQPSEAVGSDPGLTVSMALGQAGRLLARGQSNEARSMLQGAGDQTPPGLAVQRDVMLAQLDISLGRPRAALSLLQDHQGHEAAVVAAVTRARAYLALNDLDRAQTCVRSVLTAASSHVGRYLLVEALLCEAQIAQLSNDPARALDVILRAIEIAGGDIVLPFLEMATVFTALLARHPAVAAQWPMPPRGAAVPPPCGPEQPIGGAQAVLTGDLADPLTQREQAVLRFLPTSMSTAEIADELCLSVNTVKTHLAAIYRKLPASRRREAVQRARQLELI